MTSPKGPASVPPGGGLPDPASAGSELLPGPADSPCSRRHRVAKYDRELREFLLQCPGCLAKGRQSYWPLTLEFWSAWSVGKCKACRAEDDRAKQRKRRQNEATRLADNAKVAEWRAANRGYATLTTRAWRAANPERSRELNRAAYARQKARAAA